MARGLFITFEGGDGAGKSTHLRFCADAIAAHGLEVVKLREPGGTHIGEELRGIVLNPRNDAMTPECELLIYESARAQIVREVINPALERGAVVICDRFTDSTIAYQAYGRGLDRDFVEQANAFACGGLVPDRTILLDSRMSAAEAIERATHRFGADRIEMAGLDFHERVNAAFSQLAAENPQRIRCISTDGAKSNTSKHVFAALADLFPWMADEEECPDSFFSNLDISVS